MTRDTLKRQLRQAFRRDLWLTLGPAIVLVAGAFALALHFVKPAPPKKIVLAAGQDEGGFKHYSKKYVTELKKHGIELEVRDSFGSVDNVRLLADEASAVEVAFVQSGIAPPEGAEHVVSLGAVSYIPLWILHRGEPADDLSALKGKRLAIGVAGSGTNTLARELLAAVGAQAEPTVLVEIGRKEAIEQLKAGTLDALFAVAPAEAPSLRKAAAEPGVRLMSLARAEAYARRFPHLKHLVMPRGVLDLAADQPPEDVHVVAPTASLLAHDELHPALAYLLLRAASQIHGSAGLLDREGEFPAGIEGGFPLSEQARRYYKSGPPLLQRFLPFWAANFVDRLWVMFVPIIAIVVPLVRLLPPLYQWRIRSRIYRWYARLKEVELQLEEDPSHVSLEDMLKRLEEIDFAVNHIPTPLSYSDNLYSFRQHLDLVRRRVVARLSKVEAVKAA